MSMYSKFDTYFILYTTLNWVTAALVGGKQILPKNNLQKRAVGINGCDLWSTEWGIVGVNNWHLENI